MSDEFSADDVPPPPPAPPPPPPPPPPAAPAPAPPQEAEAAIAELPTSDAIAPIAGVDPLPPPAVAVVPESAVVSSPSPFVAAPAAPPVASPPTAPLAAPVSPPAPPPAAAPDPIPSPPAPGPAMPDAAAGPGLTDPARLGAAVARLSGGSRKLGNAAFMVLARVLEAGEIVQVAAQCRFRGAPGAVAVTDRRLIVVNAREWEPDVLPVGLEPGLTVHGWQDERHAALVFTRDGHDLVIDQIADRAMAQEIALAVRNRAGA